MSVPRKRPPLVSSLSVQLPSEFEKNSLQENSFVKLKARCPRRESFQSSFTSPKEDEEFVVQESNDDERHIRKLEANEPSLSSTENHATEDASASAKNEKERTFIKSPVSKAIIDNDLEELSKLIENGQDLEEEDESKLKPLHYACRLGRTEAIKQLFKAECDKSASNSDRVTSLHVAVRSGKDDVVALLLDEGVTLDVREKLSGRTPVHEATLLSNARVLKAIITKLQEDPWESQRILRIADKEGQTALHLASAGCLTEVITMLLTAGADVAATDNEGITPMHVALLSHRGKRRCGGVLKQLLEAGGDVEVVGGSDAERLSHFAARAGCSVCLEFLHKRGADLEAKDKLGRTPLHTAAFEGNFDAAKFLLTKTAGLESLDKDGHRPLHAAILSDSPSTIEAMIEAGVDKKARDRDGRTYIQMSILRRKMNAFYALVRGNTVALPEEAGEDLFHYCAALGFSTCVSHLLEKGWDINLKDAKGRTALHRALNHGHEQLATTLINAGASLHETDDNGATAIHYAVRWGGSDAILRLLIKKKAKLGVRDRLGRTPLHYAASKFSVMSDLYILLGGGSGLDTQDQMGLTPLHLAARLGNESLVRILLESGAKHDIKDVYDFLPIDHAIEKNNKSIAKRLRTHDLKLNPEKNTECEDSKDESYRDPSLNSARLGQHRKSVAW